MEPGGAGARPGDHGRRGFLFCGELRDRRWREHACIDAQVVDVGTAHEIVTALHLMRRQDAPCHPEFVEPRVEVGLLVLPGDLPAVDEEADADRLVPGEGDVGPVGRSGELVDPPRHADTREVGIGDEGIEAVAVPVDAQERHVPAGVIREADAEDVERRLADGGAGAPPEGEGAARRADVARRVPRDIAAIRPARRAADRAVGDDGHLAAEIGHRRAARDFGGGVAIEAGVEEERGVLRMRRKRDRQRGREGQDAPVSHAPRRQTVTRASRGESRWIAASATK